jgi:hypothetical protein
MGTGLYVRFIGGREDEACGGSQPAARHRRLIPEFVRRVQADDCQQKVTAPILEGHLLRIREHLRPLPGRLVQGKAVICDDEKRRPRPCARHPRGRQH